MSEAPKNGPCLMNESKERLDGLQSVMDRLIGQVREVLPDAKVRWYIDDEGNVQVDVVYPWTVSRELSSKPTKLQRKIRRMILDTQRAAPHLWRRDAWRAHFLSDQNTRGLDDGDFADFFAEWMGDAEART